MSSYFDPSAWDASSIIEKLYLLDLKQFGGDYYKILGKGTKNTKDLVNKVNEIMELPDDGSKMSGEIEKAAKPDLGSENIRSVFVKKSGKITDEISDKNVERLMNTPPLDRIETKKFKSHLSLRFNNINQPTLGELPSPASYVR